MTAKDAVDVDELAAPPARSPLTLISLVFALSVPFWLIGAATGGQLSADLPVGALMLACPAAAAAILVRREEGREGVTRLLRRSADGKRITDRRWYVPILLLMPGVYGLTYGLMWMQGSTLPTPQFRLLPALVALLVFFVSGLGEELGWSGYALDPLQERWTAFGAALVLGVAWAVWHVVPLAQIGRSPAWIAWWSLGTVGFRVILTWIYDNAGKSVFAVAVVHALSNLASVGPFLDFGPDGSPYDAQRMAGLVITAVAAIIVAVWGARTLSRFQDDRRRPPEQPGLGPAGRPGCPRAPV